MEEHLCIDQEEAIAFSSKCQILHNNLLSFCGPLPIASDFIFIIQCLLLISQLFIYYINHKLQSDIHAFENKPKRQEMLVLIDTD